jgi:dTDP-glucose 4,6-dehydratase
MKIFVAGGAGFIGCNFINLILSKYPNYQIVNFDKLLYLEQLFNLENVENKNKQKYTFSHGDINKKAQIQDAFKSSDVIINFVEEFVGNSCTDVSSNICGTINLLDIARENKISKFIQISTLNVYGSNKCDENSQIDPTNFSDVIKSSEDLFVMSYFKKYELPIIILRCPENYGQFQCPNQLISKFITNVLEGTKTTFDYSKDSKFDLINVMDQCRAIETILHYGESGNIYNLCGNNNKTFGETVNYILKLLKADESLIEFKDKLQTGEFDCSKFNEKFDWKHKIGIETGLIDTVEWYKENVKWWKQIKTRMRQRGV